MKPQQQKHKKKKKKNKKKNSEKGGETSVGWQTTVVDISGDYGGAS